MLDCISSNRITFRILCGDCLARYFIKNTRVKYPSHSNCNVKYTNEKIHDTVHERYDKCDRCFRLPP